MARMRTPEELAARYRDRYISGDSSLARLIEEAILEDRRSRPTLLGAPMDEASLRAIGERADAASTGPWDDNLSSDISPGPGWGSRAVRTGSKDSVIFVWGDEDSRVANASFVAHAREDVPALLAHIGFLTSCLFNDSEAYAAGRRCASEETALA